MRPLVKMVTDYDVLTGNTEPAGYRFVERFYATRTERWARWWLAPWLKRWNWLRDRAWYAVIWCMPYGLFIRLYADQRRTHERMVEELHEWHTSAP